MKGPYAIGSASTEDASRPLSPCAGCLAALNSSFFALGLDCLLPPAATGLWCWAAKRSPIFFGYLGTSVEDQIRERAGALSKGKAGRAGRRTAELGQSQGHFLCHALRQESRYSR